MTKRSHMMTASALGAILALVALPIAAQMADDEVTADDLGVDREVDVQVADDENGAGFTEEELAAFVTVALDVWNVRGDYAGRIDEAEDEAVALALVAEAQAEMLAAVEEADGITIERYTEIGTAAEIDPILAARLNEMITAEVANEQDDS